MRDHYFKLMYMVYCGTENGPRWGTFIKIYGINKFINELDKRMNDPWRLQIK